MRSENSELKRRIYLYYLYLLLPSVLILSAALSLLFHNAAKNQELATIRGNARLVSDLLSSGMSDGFKFSDYISYSSDAPRMTIIAPDGSVLLDSRAVADTMDNHLNRPEITEAFQTGTGESLRYSNTFGTEMYYYAIKLPDGNVLRISGNIRGIARVFIVMLPAVVVVTVLVLLLANFAAHSLTARVIAPLERIDLNSENIAVYDELAPYAKKIDQQKREIGEQITALSDRADTIEAITSHMKEGLVLTDVAGVVLTANTSAREIFGNEMENKNILHIYRDANFQQAVKQCLSGENVEMQLERIGKVYSARFSPVISGGTTRGAVMLFHDTTERNRAEKQDDVTLIDVDDMFSVCCNR